jgi:photosystem II stability/assembly factor-like uncharacterized protein
MARLGLGRVTAGLALAGALALAPAASQDRGPVVTSLTLFAGTPSGLWRSTNWGGRWERVLGRSQGVTLEDAGAVHDVLPLGRLVFVAAQAGLFLSDDFGETWRKLGLDVPVHAVLPSRYPQSDRTVFAGTADGLLKSTDAGLSFAPTVLRGTPVTHIQWPGPALVVASGNGVLVSPDGGASFTSGMGLPAGNPQTLALSSFFVVDPVLFTAVGSAGVFRSADGAKTWAPAGLEGKTVRDLVWLGPILYAATTDGLFRSDDAGRRWTGQPGLAAQPARRLIFPLAPDSGLEAFLATDSGIMHTADGGAHWKPTGPLAETVLCLATFPPPERYQPKKKGR